MKVIYIYDSLPAYRNIFFKCLAKSLNEDNIDMKVFCGNLKGQIVHQASESDFSLKRFKTKIINLKFIQPAYFPNLMDEIKKERPDAVIMQIHPAILTYWKILNYCNNNDIPCGGWDCFYVRPSLHPFFSLLRKLLYKRMYNLMSGYITYGTRFKDYLINNGISPDRIFVAQNTIDVDSIVSNYNERVKSFNSTVRVLYVGALIRPKHPLSVILAIDNLIKKGYKVTLEMIGDGHIINELKEKVSSLSTKDKIFILGAKYEDEVIPYFENCDVFILPGTGGLAVNEAMAYGLPIISTIGDETIADLIDGNGYLLLNFGNVSEIESAIEEFINLSNEEKLTMSKRSLQLIQERASLKNMVSQHKKACKMLITKK